MPTYSCKLCKYSTTKKTDYTRHIVTKNHQKKVQHVNGESIVNPIRIQYESSNKFMCMYCPNTYSTQSNLSKHMKKCANKVVIEVKQESKSNEVDNLRKKVEILEKQNNTYEQMIKSFTCPQTINNITYIVEMYSDAPALKKLTSYSDILDAKTMTLVDVSIMYYERKKIDKFIGDFIIKSYKKKEPNEQSMWSSDVSRLTYIINESCKSGENIWSYDKGGVKLKECIIDPALEHIRNELFQYYMKNIAATEIYMLKRQMAINEIITIIDNDTLANNIIKYIAPKFTIKKIKAITDK